MPRFVVPAAGYRIDGATIMPALRDSERRFGPVMIGLPAPPTLADIRAARRHYELTGMPVGFEPAAARPGPLAAYSLRVSGDGAPAELTLLADEAAAGGPVTVTINGAEALALKAPPPNRRLTLPLDAEGGSDTAVVSLGSGPPGARRISTFMVATPRADEPRILLAAASTGPKSGARSVVEALRPVRRIGFDELAAAGVYGYELVVLDGPELAALGGGVIAALAGYVERGSGSLLLVVDSPSVGKPGDAPALERLLPVELSPRGLSRLPDVAMAVAMDVSGSMYGDKLSLAKAAGLELVRNLKPTDAAGIMLFDEEARWLYPLAPVADLDAGRSLAPLRAGGGTRLHPAVEACLDALEAASFPDKRLVVVSDGITARADFDALAARAFRAGVVITTMAVGAEYDEALLTRLAAGSGGRFYRVRDADEVPSLIAEDRKSLSRAVFAEEHVDVVDLAGAPAGSLGGMARLGLKPDAIAYYSSLAGDPLLSARRIGARSALVYASDLYGKYGSAFLSRPSTLSVLDAVIGGLYSERPPSATVTETADGLAVSIGGDFLAAPRAALADEGGRIVYDEALEPTGPGLFHAALGRPAPGRYTALIEDRGRTVARFAVYSNGGASAAPSDSALAARDYRMPFWILARGGAPWLIAFFSLSLAATLMLRLRR